MVKHCCIPLESPSEWRDALTGIRHTFGHTWENCQAMYLTTGHRTFLYCYEAGDVRMVCPMTEREYRGHVDILKPFGFSGFVGNAQCADFPRHWQEFARKQGYVCGYLGFNPLFDFSSHFAAEEVHQYDVVHVLDLTPGLDQLVANLHRNRRRYLKNWDDTTSGLIYDRAVLKKFFLENYLDFVRSRNASSVYFFTRESLEFLLDLDNLLLVGAGSDGRVEAVTVFVYTDDAVDALFNVSLPEGQGYSTLLIWHGVRHFRSLGIPLLNLGGGGEGCYEFKRRFGCSQLPLKCLKQVYQQGTYEQLCRDGNLDPAEKSGYFPLYRKVA